MTQPFDHSEDTSFGHGRFNRRRLIGATVLVAAGGLTYRAATAQDASPEATPQPQQAAAASPEANAIGSERFPIRTELGPAVPPEYGTETNWPSENRDLSSTRNAKGSNINTGSIGDLGLAWQHAYKVDATFGALVAAPAIVGDVLYQQDAKSNVTAFNKTSGDVLWTNTHDSDVPSGGPNGIGVGYDHVVYTLGGPGDVLAVKPDTGEEIWRTNILGYRDEGITMAPIVYDSTVYVSTIPGTPEAFYNGNQRGFLIAINLSDGKVLWYMDTTADNLYSDGGGNARINSGGGLWHPPSFDDQGMLYAGLGNASPYPGIPEWPAGSSRPGDNNYADSLLKIDPSKATIEWFLNVKPHDLFDLDNQLSPILTTASVDGTDTPIALTSGKHGNVVAVNRDTGKEIWRTPVGKHQNDELQELDDTKYVEVFPGTLGGVETPLALGDGVVYAAVYNLASWYNGGGLDATRFDFTKATGELVALDIASGDVKWDVQLASGPLAGATVVNDVVFTAGLDGVIHGFNTDDGSKVFTWQAGAGINAPLSVSGDYLYVPAGGPLLPSDDSSDPGPSAGASLIALKLGGKQQEAVSASPEASPGTAPEASPGAAAGANSINVTASEFKFDPNTLEIPADTDVQITLKNGGTLQHDMSVPDLKITSDLTNGGDSTTFTVKAPAGEYKFICSVAGHEELGMVGKLTVA